MELKQDTRLLLPGGRRGITLGGDCRAGHRRRCPVAEAEAPLFLGEGVWLECRRTGMGTFIGQGTRIRRTEEIGRFTTIGENCIIGAPFREFSGIISTSYPVRDPSVAWCRDFFSVSRPPSTGSWNRPLTVIGNDVLVGDGALICQGVSLGDGSVVAPGSVVTADVPPYAVAAGSPAKLYSRRFEPEEVRRLLRLQWWNYGTALLKDADLNERQTDRLLDVLEEKAEGCRQIPFMEQGIVFRYSGNLFSIYSMEDGQRKLIFQLPDR